MDPIDLQLQRGRKRLSPVPDIRMQSIWRDIASKVRLGWFYSSEALLRAYVSTIAQLETLGRWLHEEEPRSECYCKLLRIQLSVTKTAAMLATRLRLTPRSPYDRYQPKVVPNFRKPWEPDPEEA